MGEKYKRFALGVAMGEKYKRFATYWNLKK